MLSRTSISALLCTLMLVACGDKPDAMLTSAKGYLQKGDTKAAVIQIKNALQVNPDIPEARLMLGKALFDGGDAVGAETEFKKALALKVPLDDVVPQLAMVMLAQGRAKEVVDEYGQFMPVQAADIANFQTTLAGAYAALGQEEKSASALMAAMAADPGYERALLVQARQKASKRDADGALAIVESVLAKAPMNFEALKLRGDIQLFAKKQPDDALASYRKSVDVRADFIAGHAAAIRLLLQQKKLDEAEKQIGNLKAVAPNHPQTKFFEAQLAFVRKDFKLARSHIQQVLKASPNNALGLQLAGAIELELNSGLQAEDYLSKAIQLAPDLQLARRLLVATYLRTGNMSKATTTLMPGLTKDPVDPELLSLAGDVYLQSGNARKAEEYYAKAIKQDPQSAKKRTALAVTQLMSGKSDAAFGELENIAASDKGTTADMALISAHLRRQEYDKALKAIGGLEKKMAGKPIPAMLQGQTYLAKNDTPMARKSFERAAAIDPTYFQAVASLASLDMADKKPDEARKRFDALLAKDPKNGQALLALAELGARTGAGKDEVAMLIANAVNANPKDTAPRMLLIDFQLRNKDFKAALSSAQDANAAIPDGPELLDALGRTQLAAGETNQAVATFTKLATLMPASPAPYMRLAEVHMAAKNKEAAAQSLRKALELKPDLQQAQRGTIMLDLESKNFQGAVATARSMQKQSPADPVGYVLEGDINASQKNWESAAVSYRTGLKQAPSPELALKLHSVLLAAGKTAEAQKFADGWQKDHPSDASFLLYLADGAIGRKDFATAERHYLNVIKLQPGNAVAYNNLAWVTSKLGKDGAIAYAEKSLVLAPNQPAFMDTLAGILSDKNEHAKAVELQKKVVDLQPDAPLFKLNLAKIQIRAGDKSGAKAILDELAKLGDKFAGQLEVAALLKKI